VRSLDPYVTRNPGCPGRLYMMGYRELGIRGAAAPTGAGQPGVRLRWGPSRGGCPSPTALVMVLRVAFPLLRQVAHLMRKRSRFRLSILIAMLAALVLPGGASAQDELPVHSPSRAQAQRDAEFVTRYELLKRDWEPLEDSLRARCRRAGAKRNFRCRISFAMGDSEYRGSGIVRNNRRARIRYRFRVRGACTSETCTKDRGKFTLRWRWRGTVVAPLV
jgi:hypothetical protein